MEIREILLILGVVYILTFMSVLSVTNYFETVKEEIVNDLSLNIKLNNSDDLCIYKGIVSKKNNYEYISK